LTGDLNVWLGGDIFCISAKKYLLKIRKSDFEKQKRPNLPAASANAPNKTFGFGLFVTRHFVVVRHCPSLVICLLKFTPNDFNNLMTNDAHGKIPIEI
jgi:hypothetical protein